MSKFNVTIDDFDPVVHYSNYADWETPNPQETSADAKASSPWHQATYHNTTVKDAKASFNFTGTGFWIYGAANASTFTITIDPSAAKPFSETVNGTAGEKLLYGVNTLSNSHHEVEIENTGSGLLLDLIVVETEFGAEGATITNTTLDDRAQQIKYDGKWTQQEGPDFFDKTSTYTEGPNNSLEVNFTGSAVWVYGDQVNDHGEFSVAINGTTLAVNNGRSGCGGGYAKYCEKLHGLAFFTTGLPEGTHTLKIENHSPNEGNMTFFDFDYLEYATPSLYANASVSSDCPFVDCGNNTNVNGTSTSGVTNINGTSTSSVTPAGNPQPTESGAAAASGTGMLALVFAAWVLRALF